jgi:hypothetical protein
LGRGVVCLYLDNKGFILYKSLFLNECHIGVRAAHELEQEYLREFKMDTNLRRSFTILGGTVCHIVMSAETAKRLSGTCFRGRHMVVSGNLAIWSCFEDVLDDEFVMDDLIHAIEGVIIKEDGHPSENSRRLQIVYPTDVGWSSTSRCIDESDSWWCPDDEEFDLKLVEKFPRSHRVRGYRVRLDRTDIQAPLDYNVTLGYELRFTTDNGWEAEVFTIYPGENIGRLSGDMTKKGFLFFDFNHPGQPLAQSDTLTDC